MGFSDLGFDSAQGGALGFAPSQGPGGAEPPDPLTIGMIEWWAMNEISGIRTGSKAAIALSDVNTVTSDTGRIGLASEYVSSNSERLTTTSSAMALAANASWSASVWVYMDSMSGSTTGDSHSIMGRANPSATPANITELALNIFPASYSYAPYRNKAVFWHYSASNYKELISSGTFSASTWYHICLGYDASATGAEMWMVVNDGTPQTLSDSAGMSEATSGVFSFGNIENNAIYFSGRTDLDAFWSRTITAAEITRLYNSGSGMVYPG